MNITIVIILIVGLIFIFSIILGSLDSNSKIDLYDEKAVEKVLSCNYELLEIKRYRNVRFRDGLNEYPLEGEIKSFLGAQSDFIRVYGIKKKNKTEIFEITWDMDNAKKIKDIVNKINEEIKN